MSRVVSPQGVGTPLTVTQNLDEITDEGLLRQMWHEAHDVGERRRIRSRMYKLRERHLREMVKNDEENLGALTISSDGVSSSVERRSSKSSVRRQSGSDQGANESESNEDQDTRRDSTSSRRKSSTTRVMSDEEIIEEKVKIVSKGRTDRYNRIINEMDDQSPTRIESKKGYSVQPNALAGDSYQSMRKQEVRDSVSPTRSSYHRYSGNEESEGRTTSDEEGSTRTVIKTTTRTTTSPLGTKSTRSVTKRRVSKELVLPAHPEEVKTTSSATYKTAHGSPSTKKSSSKNTVTKAGTNSSTKTTGGSPFMSRKTISSESTVSTEHSNLGSYLMTDDPEDEIIEEEEEEEEDESGNVVRTVIQTRRSKDGSEYTARRVARTTKIVDSESDINEILIGNPDHELIDRQIEEKDEGDDSKIKIITETRRRPDGIEYTTRNILKTSKIFDYDHPENVTYCDEDELMESKEDEEMDEQGIIIRTITETRKKPNGVEYITKKVYKTSKVHSRLPDGETNESRTVEEKQVDVSTITSRQTVPTKNNDRTLNQKNLAASQNISAGRSLKTTKTDSGYEISNKSNKTEFKSVRERKTGSTERANRSRPSPNKTAPGVIEELPIQASSDDEILDEKTTEAIQDDGSTVKTRVERRKAKDGAEYLRHKILRIPKLPDAKLVVGSLEDEVLDKDISEDVLEDGSECRAVTERRRSSVTGVLYTLRRMSRTFQPSCHLYGMDEIIDENTTEEETSDGVVIKTVIRRYRRSDDTVYTTHNVTKTYTSPVLVRSNHSPEDELVDRSYDVRETYDGFMIKTIMETRSRPDGVHYTVERTEKLAKPDDFDSSKIDLSSAVLGDLDDTIISSEEHEEPGEETGIVVKTILESRKRKDGTEYTNKITVKTTQFLAPQHETSYVVIKPDEKDGQCSFMPSLDDDILEVKKRRENDTKGNLMEVINETRLSRSTGKKYNLTKRVKVTDVVITEDGEKILAKVPSSTKKNLEPLSKPISSRDRNTPKTKVSDSITRRTPRSEAPKAAPKNEPIKFTSKTRTFEPQKSKPKQKTPSPIVSGTSVSERKRLFMGKTNDTNSNGNTRKPQTSVTNNTVLSRQRVSGTPTEKRNSPSKFSEMSRTSIKENTVPTRSSVRSNRTNDTANRNKTTTESKPTKRVVTRKGPGESSTDSDCVSSSNESRRSPGRDQQKTQRKSPPPSSPTKLLTNTATSSRQCCEKANESQERKLKKTDSNKSADKSPNTSSSESSSNKRPNSIKIGKGGRSTRSPTSSGPSSPTKTPTKSSPLETYKTKINKNVNEITATSRRPLSKSKDKPESPTSSSHESPLMASTRRTPSKGKIVPIEDKKSSRGSKDSSDDQSPQKKRTNRPSDLKRMPAVSPTESKKQPAFDDKFRKTSQDDAEVKSSRLVRDVQSKQTSKLDETVLDESVLSQIIPDGMKTGLATTEPLFTPTDKVKKPYNERRLSVEDIEKRPSSLGVRTNDATERVPVVEPLVKKRYIYRLGEDDEEEEDKPPKKCSSEDLGLTSTKLVLKTMSPEPKSPLRESSPRLRSVSPLSTPDGSRTESFTRSFSKEPSPSRFVTGKPIDQGPNTKKLKLLERTGSNKALYENSEEKEKELKPVLQRVQSISELEELETLLEQAKTYEERRIIRGRIRTLKKAATESKTTTTSTTNARRFVSKTETSRSPNPTRRFEGVDSTQTSTVRDKPFVTEDDRKPVRTTGKTSLEKPSKIEPIEDYPKKTVDRTSPSRTTSTMTRKTSSEFEKRKLSFETKETVTTKTEVDLQPRKSSLKSTESTKTTTRRKSSSQEESLSESESYSRRRTDRSTFTADKTPTKPSGVNKSSPSPVKSFNKTSTVPSRESKFKPSTPKTVSDKKSQSSSSSVRKTELTAEAHVDTIMSPYGVGPTDENGVPLVGLRALKRRPRASDDQPMPVAEPPKQKDTITSSLFGIKSVQKKTISEDTKPDSQRASPQKAVDEDRFTSESVDSSPNSGDEVDTGRRRRFRKKYLPKHTDDTESDEEEVTSTNKEDQPSNQSGLMIGNQDAYSHTSKRDIVKSTQSIQSSQTSESESESTTSTNKKLKNIILLHESKATTNSSPSSPSVTTPKRRLVETFEPSKDTESKTHKTWDLQSDLKVRSDDVGNIIAKHETLVKHEVPTKPKVGILKRSSTGNKSSTDSSSDQHTSIEYTDVRGEDSKFQSSEQQSNQFVSTSEMPDQKSFLSDSSKVSGIQDVLSRMGATEAVDHEVAVTTDDQAKSLLNKFLGAQVLMSGVESMMANSSISDSNRQSSHQMSFAPPSMGISPMGPAGGRVAAKTAMFTPKPVAAPTNSSSVTQESEPFIYKGVNINEVAESYELDELLDSCQEYEPRRRIKKRLGELLAKERAELLGQIGSSTRKIGSTGKVTTVLGSSVRSNEGGSKSYATSTFSSGPTPPGQFTGGQQSGAKGKRNISGPLFTLSTSLNRSASGVKDMILNWCQCRTRGYQGVKIENFSTSWNDGMAFCALIHHFYPDAFDFNALNPKNRKYNFSLAFRVADEKAGVFPLLDVEDMVMMQKPDWKCVFTYVQTLYKRLKDE